jgi:hypothetical protein
MRQPRRPSGRAGDHDVRHVRLQSVEEKSAVRPGDGLLQRAVGEATGPRHLRAEEPGVRDRVAGRVDHPRADRGAGTQGDPDRLVLSLPERRGDALGQEARVAGRHLVRRRREGGEDEGPVVAGGDRGSGKRPTLLEQLEREEKLVAADPRASEAPARVVARPVEDRDAGASERAAVRVHDQPPQDGARRRRLRARRLGGFLGGLLRPLRASLPGGRVLRGRPPIVRLGQLRGRGSGGEIEHDEKRGESGQQGDPSSPAHGDSRVPDGILERRPPSGRPGNGHPSCRRNRGASRTGPRRHPTEPRRSGQISAAFTIPLRGPPILAGSAERGRVARGPACFDSRVSPFVSATSSPWTT